MNRQEHLLCILAEECAEVAQRASKAMRFGLAETEPGQSSENAERLSFELCDLMAVAEILATEGYLELHLHQDCVAKRDKKRKVERFLRYSAELGTLTVSDEESKL